ncbi:endo-1,4-beta-xylanase 1-like isoform X1 [Miscanthus floridulus]|uniref:endo-1,4-beta-xylanase 1-like isoform X1 n=2 Tax=Miscanthus floridulus TaxID=154761 RepID=UPI0034590C18
MRRRCGWLSSLFRPRRAGRALPQPDPQGPDSEPKAVDKHSASDEVVMENILSNSDFSEDLHLWQPNSCHAFVAVEGSGYHYGVRPHSGSTYAVLTHRTQSWQGLEQDITEKVTLGTEYFVAAYVRVHGEVHEPIGVQITLKLEEGSSTNYLSIARILASQEHWEKMEGSFNLTTLPRRLVFYLEGPSPGVDLLIDSVTISYKKTEGSASSIGGTENIILNYDFSKGLHPWNPICCHAYVASQWSGFLDGIRGNSGENYAVVSKRTEHWQGLEQDITNQVSIGTAYVVSAFVRVDGNVQGQVEVKGTLRLQNADGSTCYNPVGSSVVASKEKWNKLEGSFSLTNMPKNVVFYLEGPPAGVDLVIDSVTITCSRHKQSKEVKVPSRAETIIKNPHFEDGLKNWSGRGCNICRHEFTAYGNVRPLNGSYFASATGRVHNWNGIQQEITGRVQRKVLYEISSAVRIFGSANDTEVRATLWVQEYGRERYVGLAKNQTSDKQWTHLKGKFLLHAPFTKAVIFIEGPPAGIDILVDGLVLSPARKLQAAPCPKIENVLYGTNLLHNNAFTRGLAGWSPMGSCRLSIQTETPHMLSSILKDRASQKHISGRYILATNRTDVWMGPSQVITDKLRLHVTYRVSAWVRVGSGGHGRHHVNVCLAVDNNQWVNGGQVEADGDRWYEINGAFKLEKQPSKVTAYVQGPPPGVDLRVMDFQIYPVDRKARFEYLKEKTDKVRKRDVVLKFQGSNAVNLLGSSVRIQQTENSFPFGSCIARHNIENEDLAEFFVKNFNWAVFENELKWYHTEAEQGRLNYKDSDELLEFCEKHKIQVRGHCLFWEVEDAVQPWVRSLQGHHLMAAIQNRLQSLLSRYKDRFRHHDVNNEMLHGSFYEDRLGRDIRAYMFREAHKLDPSAVLFVNDYNVEDGCDTKSTPEKFVEQVVDLQERGAPVGGIGVQGHISHPVGEIICDSLDKLAILGLPIWITELDVTAENEHIRADDLEVFLREAFAHPAVGGIILWGFWEMFMFREHAHLVDADGTINEAGRRYLALKQEWLTRMNGNVDHQGEFKFRGYHGSYTVEVDTPSGKVARSFVVDKDSPVQVVTLNV